MNSEPHAHRIEVENRGEYGWRIGYGDRNTYVPRPFRWWWDSEEAYAKRLARRVKREIAKIVRRHDRASRATRFLPVVPEFKQGFWGSEQLK